MSLWAKRNMLETLQLKEIIKSRINHLVIDADKIKPTAKDDKGKKFWDGYKLACDEILQIINDAVI
jgi:hypothetical protein